MASGPGGPPAFTQGNHVFLGEIPGPRRFPRPSCILFRTCRFVRLREHICSPSAPTSDLRLRGRDNQRSSSSTSEPNDVAKSRHPKVFPVYLGQMPSSRFWPSRPFEVWPLLAFPTSSYINPSFSPSDENILYLCHTIQKPPATCGSSELNGR